MIVDDAIEDLSENPSGVTTKSGKSIPDADFVVRIPCQCRARNAKVDSCKRQIQVRAFGATPNTPFLKSLGDDVLNDSGRVKVNEFLEVAGHPGVYALGDIIDWKEEKQAAKIAGQSAVVIANLLSFLAGGPSKKAYKGSVEAIIIPLGKVSPRLVFLWLFSRSGRMANRTRIDWWCRLGRLLRRHHARRLGGEDHQGQGSLHQDLTISVWPLVTEV